jgi:hypothetical protein
MDLRRVTNLELCKDENNELLADSQKFWTDGRITCRLLNVHGLNGVRQTNSYS